MEQFQLRNLIVEVCERLELGYFITGSHASIFYGEMRFTNDIDVVIQLPLEKVTAFCAAFPATDFYVSETAARSAVANASMFNIIQPDSGLKIDVITPGATAFERSRLGRSMLLEQIDGPPARFTSPEDLIVMKLRFFEEGGSEKHVRDITSMLNTQRGHIDVDYVAKWADDFGVGDLWSKILSEVDASPDGS